MAVTDDLELVAVRHGLTAWNLQRRYQGHQDIPLDMSAAAPGLERLRKALADWHFDVVYCSDLIRCRQTLSIISEGRDWPDAQFDLRLRELSFGDYEGHTYEELVERSDYRAWVDKRGAIAPPGGERADELGARLIEWLNEARERATELGQCRLLVVTHGGTIRELRRHLEGVDFWDSIVDQAQGYRFILTGDGQCKSSSVVPAPESATP
ncbi:MAG: histidine phosphatase family protein [Halomonas sp.]|uniref:histidine phosphatase family protein n=1 Tax=Halomonas sp. TaxID=1486246 RepID=UPI003F8F5E55